MSRAGGKPQPGAHWERAVRRAVALLVWIRATGTRFFLASWVTLITILWDTVLMNRISRSGVPSFRFRSRSPW